MIPEQVFHRILALGEGWKVRQVNCLDKGGKVMICVEDTPSLWAMAAFECLPVAIGDSMPPASRTLRWMRQGLHGESALGRAQPESDPGI